MKKFKKFLKGIRKEEKIIAATGATVGAATVAMQANATQKAGDIVGNLLGYVFGIFFYIGIMLLAWGIGQLVLAFKNEDGDSKSRAIMLILASIVLMGISQIFTGLNLGVTTSLNTNF